MKAQLFKTTAMVLLLVGCGGSEKTSTIPTITADVAPPPPEVPGPPCTRPIENPKEVWQRVEQARTLSREELTEQCGLAFVSAMSEWRCPPVDLLRPIILNEERDKNALIAWVTAQSEAGNRAAVHAAAMDILGNWSLGDDPVEIRERAAAWKPLAGRSAAIDAAVEEIETLEGLLRALKEIHELRCALEVNPLGFAVSCTPIHPAREKIDLSWQEEIQDGLFQKVELTKCKGSPSCKKLKIAAADFAVKYQAALARAESLKTDVFKEQALEWLKLPPFSKGGM